MDIFGSHEFVVDEYRRYVRSFLTIADDRIRAAVEDRLLNRGGVCPEALVQLNPGFERGRDVAGLVADGLLHPLCADIFRNSQLQTIGLYRHQEEAILRACQGLPFVVTSGTGSGKSLTYKIPIVDHVLRHDPAAGRSRAILVYPTNALINSQLKAIEDYLGRGGEDHGVTVARCTGQEDRSRKQHLQKHPPHILLTNPMMLGHRHIRVLGSSSVALWAALLGPVACAEETPPSHYLSFHSNYGMVMGPVAVTWCSKLSTQDVLVARHSANPLEYSPLASVVRDGATDPVFQILLPYASQDEQPFILTMNQAGKVYYADAHKHEDGTTTITVQAYLSVAEFAALVSDPTPCLTIEPKAIENPSELYRRLSSSPYLKQPLQARASELLAEVEKLYKALYGPQNPNEPWAGPKPESEKFRQRLLDLLNSAVGQADMPQSLYATKLYDGHGLPVQIIEVMRQIYELGGPYNCDGELNQRDDPWRDLRPQTPEAPEPKRTPEINQKIRLLLEYELGGCLQGTMYHWRRIITGYGPCVADVAPGRFTNPPGATHREHFAHIMPIMLTADGKLQLLLDHQPQPLPTGWKCDLPFFTVGTGGELAGPLPRVSATQVFVVQGQQVEWVDVETEGKTPKAPQ